MVLEEEEDVAGFLGVHIERDEAKGTIKLTQKGLTQRIIEALCIEDLPAVETPASDPEQDITQPEPDASVPPAKKSSQPNEHTSVPMSTTVYLLSFFILAILSLLWPSGICGGRRTCFLGYNPHNLGLL